MNKAELIDFIANNNDSSKIEARRAIDLFISGIVAAARDGNNVSLIGFGNFNIIEVAARVGINPKTKEPMQIAAHKQVRFKVGQSLKNSANNGEKAKSGEVKNQAIKKNTNGSKTAKAKK